MDQRARRQWPASCAGYAIRGQTLRRELFSAFERKLSQQTAWLQQHTPRGPQASARILEMINIAQSELGLRV